VLGFRVPLAGLADWVRGRQVEGAEASVVRGGDGRLASLKQSGWSVEYQEYRADGLPVRMKLTYPGIELRLAIHEWKTARQ
jgi:outer membrane lipoprotein LolB